MGLRVKEVADLVGISVRTLHHYDKIGLLTPANVTEAGYRLYNDDDLESLQQILFFRELDFPLKKIKEIINSPSFNRKEALIIHRKMLLEKQERITKMIRMIDKTTKYLKGEIKMTNSEKFSGFDFTQNQYEKEARKRWGDEAVNRTNDTLNNMTAEEQKSMGEKMNDIYRKLAEVRKLEANSDEAQEAIKQWYDFLNSTGHHYSLEAFTGLGQMYLADERFTKNIDQFGDGLAQFMCEAMEVFAKRNK